MKVLLDTHAFLWYFTADRRLSSSAVTIMADVRNELVFSMASAWEIGIKSSIGKLTLPGPFATLIPQQLQQANIMVLEIKLEHIAFGCTLPFHHRDPFDRLLVAQSLLEKLPMLSDQYSAQRIW